MLREALKSLGPGAEVKPRGVLLGALLAGVLCTGVEPAPLSAQSRFFPDVPSFELPLADPRGSSFAGRVIDLSRGESQFGDEREADVAIGESFPALALRRGDQPIALSFGVLVYGRFSLDDSKTSMISSDWSVGFDVHTTRNDWEFALQIYHESSHLGDEYIKNFQARRIDWTREVLTGWIGYRPGNWRIMAGAGRVLQDELDLSPWLARAGVDYRSGGFTALGQRVVPIVGVFLDGESATDWRISSDVKLGLAIPGAKPGRELRLSIVRHDGLSTQRQFFRNDSRYVGMELEFQL